MRPLDGRNPNPPQKRRTGVLFGRKKATTSNKVHVVHGSSRVQWNSSQGKVPKDISRFGKLKMRLENPSEGFDAAWQLAQDEEQRAADSLQENVERQTKLMEELDAKDVYYSDSDEMQRLESENRILTEEYERAKANTVRLLEKGEDEED